MKTATQLVAVLALAAAGLSANSAQAHIDDFAARTLAVNVQDLDLDSARGQQVLLRRIKWAADIVCGIPNSRDLRMLVRERITAGDADDAIMQFVVARYGEFVLLRPRFGWHTAILWLAPLALIALIAFILLTQFKARRLETTTNDPARPLTADEQLRLEKLLGRNDP